MTSDYQSMQSASLAFPGAALASAVQHPALQAQAEWCAERQAQLNRQGHHQWQRRFEELNLLPRLTGFMEICAESWPWQVDLEPEKLWEECFRCWKQSPGHWSVASSEHACAGAAMRKSRRGIWYAAVVVGDWKTEAQKTAGHIDRPNRH